MPVRSLTSSVLKWPDLKTVEQALRRWAKEAADNHHELMAIGYFGSYGRGAWGVGSDLDIVMIVENSVEPFERRAIQWDVTRLPVPADILIYTKKEWQSLRQEKRFYQTLKQEAVWVYRQKRQ